MTRALTRNLRTDYIRHPDTFGDAFNTTWISSADANAAAVAAGTIPAPAGTPAAAAAGTSMMTYVVFAALGLGGYLLYKHYKNKGSETVHVTSDGSISPRQISTYRTTKTRRSEEP